ncbi:MAG: hypothetical protein GC178_17975 [Flavobacteriales bacterium]|nr:hypothetical protein [Flavobacteriales bacterium]
MRRLFLTAVHVLFLTVIVQAQNREIIGSIKSAKGWSLAESNVLDVNSQRGTAADAFGKFQLSVADSGTVLRVSHVGYRPILYKVTPEMFASDGNVTNLQIVLNQESTLLSAAVVTAEQHIVLDSHRGVVLRDFSFAAGHNILLMAQDGIRYLMLCDDQWKEISRLRVDKKGDRLYEDCLGNVHLFGKDSVYQIAVVDDQIQFVTTVEESYFVKEMGHCSTSSNSHIFFSSYQSAGQEVYHYGFDRKTKEGVILEHVFDREGLRSIEDYIHSIQSNPYRHRSRGNQPYSTYAGYSRNTGADAYQYRFNHHPGTPIKGTLYGAPGIYRPYYYSNQNMTYADVPNMFGYSAMLSDHYAQARSQRYFSSVSQYFQAVSNQNLEFKQTMLNTWNPSPAERAWLNMIGRPTYSPMFNLRDSIFIFDHVVGICYVHDADGKEVRSFPIEHQELSGWKRLLIPDENGKKLYAHLRRGNKSYLAEISLDDGRVLGTTYLPDATFVEHLKVKDGYAYYLKQYHDIFTSDRMFKQRL